MHQHIIFNIIVHKPKNPKHKQIKKKSKFNKEKHLEEKLLPLTENEENPDPMLAKGHRRKRNKEEKPLFFHQKKITRTEREREERRDGLGERAGKVLELLFLRFHF